MGLEMQCRVWLNERASLGRAHCGDGEIAFKGDFRFRWLWKDLECMAAEGGFLRVVRNGETARLELGEAAEKWLHAIRHPKSRLDKLGVKPESAYAAHGVFDATFAAELEGRAGAPGDEPFDLLFQRLDGLDDLPKLAELRSLLAPSGAIWAVWRKGRKELREDDVRNYALANGLVDVKVASFNEELSALKLVIPRALRP
jgi:hypothetical protein